ncbi:MAG: S41 family peptidase [Candidatus Staskawiczbacteria bacterium]|nr:S41 family peptidase [Candidatus Staskawiczbacteria bacterium]
MKSKSRKIIYSAIFVICLAGAFGLGAWFGVTKLTYNVPQPEGIDFSLFWDAYNKLQDNFIDPTKIDNQKIIYGAIEGMAKSLDDPYTDFFNPEQAHRFQQDLSGSFEGIGVEIGIKKDLLTVIAPLEGTPGQRAGLKAGDIILKIDGKDSTNITTDDAVNLIRGAKGTDVTLTIAREGWTSSKDIKITRGTITIPPLKWELKNGNIAYIQIFQFDESLSPDFNVAAREILQSPARKIILDLRNNPGGYLEVAQTIAGWFLQNGQTVTIEDLGANKEQKIYKAEGNASLSGYPVVVLINEGSASASEILAGALRDNMGVQLIGVKSFGKGSVQEVINLRGGSFLKITIAKWLTPNGNSISEVGLEPDIKVDITEQDIEEEKDPQLDKALEIIGTLN